MARLRTRIPQARRPAFSSYRHIPHYRKTMERVEAEREQMLAFILETSDKATSVDQVVAEIASSASSLSVSFDEALFFKWRYCRNLHEACERIAALRPKCTSI